MVSLVYLCVDIGGTKISSGLSDGKTVWQTATQPVAKGIVPLLHQLHQIYATYATDPTFPLSAVCIGCPGNIIDHHIAPGSAQNLGTFPGEFDHFNLRQALEDLPIPVYIFNDATAQMAGGYALLHNTLAGVDRIGYIGPGTGLGGGFSKVDETGINTGLQPVTDGHIFDILLPQRRGGSKGVRPASLRIAEDLLSGRAFFAQTGQFARDAGKTPEKYQPLMVEWGQTLALLIRTLHQGPLRKPATAPPWSADEIAFVQTVDHYLIGGGMGTAHPFGDWMIQSARNTLATWQLPITLHRIPDVGVAGLLGVGILGGSK